MGRCSVRARQVLTAMSGIILGTGIVTSSALAADAPGGFYENKTLSLYVGVEASSNYASYGRLVGQYIAKHIAGNPTVVVRFMPGAATLVLANYLYNVAPKDGTAIGLIHERMGLLPLIDPKGIQYDPLKFNWLGAASNQLSACYVWHTSSIRTIEDAKTREVLVGGTNVGGSSEVFPRVLNDTLVTKFKVISGYRGSQEMDLAMERGETEGRCGFGWVALKATKPDWVRDGKIRVLMQMGMKKAADLPNVPLIIDEIKDPNQKLSVEFFLSSSEMAYPFTAPPGLPGERVKTLRDAFDATMADPELMATATTQKLDITPISGVEIEKLLVRFSATPKPIIEPAKAWLK